MTTNLLDLLRTTSTEGGEERRILRKILAKLRGFHCAWETYISHYTTDKNKLEHIALLSCIQ